MLINPLVGTVLQGYCDGYFIYPDYGDKRIEAIGADWLVVRGEDGRVNFARFESTDEMRRLVGNWCQQTRT